MKIIGIVQKISTTSDQSIRLVIDVDKGQIPDDIFTTLYKEAIVYVQEEESNK